MKKSEFAINLIIKSGWSDEQATGIANFLVQFVREVGNSLKKY